MKTCKFFMMRQIHQAITLLVLVIGIGSISSVYAQDKTHSQNRTTIVFVDKTLSVEPDSFIQEKNHSWLKRIVKENTLNTGDKIIISFIFENTSNATNKFEFVYHPPQQRTGKMSSSEARIAKVKYAKRLRAYKRNFADKVITKAFSFKPSLSGTDVMGSIKLLSDISTASRGQILKAFYFSDMQECSSFRLLFCGKTDYAVKSIDHALTLAKKDLPRILKRYQLSNACLNNYTEITVVFPSHEFDTDKAFAILPSYWNYIFTQLGTKQINFY